MEIKNYAIIDSSGNIINTVVWDGNEETWKPSDELTAVPCGSSICEIGGVYNNGEFSRAPIPEPTKEEYISSAELIKSSLMAEVNTYTQPWQTQLMLGIITDLDKESLTTWMKYYQQLQSVETSSAPDIVWPDHP